MTRSELLAAVYDDLRALGARELAREKPGQTLDATAFVHEAYPRLGGRAWADRGHFFACAAEAMRSILIDAARRKRGPKRGGRLARADVPLDRLAAPDPDVDLIAPGEALTRLAVESPPRAESVEVRSFAGLSVAQAAGVSGVSVATAERYWAHARAWLFAELAGARG